MTEGYVLTHNTVLFSALGREVRMELAPGQKVLVVAHRDELIEQARDKWLKVEPDAIVGIYKAERRETWADVIVASIQSCYPDRHDEDTGARWPRVSDDRVDHDEETGDRENGGSHRIPERLEGPRGVWLPHAQDEHRADGDPGKQHDREPGVPRQRLGTSR